MLQEAFARSDLILITGGLGPTNDDVTREVVSDLLQTRTGSRRGDPSEDSRDVHEPGTQAQILQRPAGHGPGRRHRTRQSEWHRPGNLFSGHRSQSSPLSPARSAARVGYRCGRTWSPRRIAEPGGVRGPSRIVPQFSDPRNRRIRHRRLPRAEGRFDSRDSNWDTAPGSARWTFASSETDLPWKRPPPLIRREIPGDASSPNRRIPSPASSSISSLEKGQTVATAESCTGGLIASTITDESGSSGVFHRGYVTYSNDVKTALLGVPPSVLEEHGAVSEPTVRAMAEGCPAGERSGSRHRRQRYRRAHRGKRGKTGRNGVTSASRAADEETFVKHWFWPAERIAFKARVCRLALDLLRRRILGFSTRITGVPGVLMNPRIF